MESVLDKFLRYVKVDTPSDPENDGVMPSSQCQFDLAHLLVEELHALGVDNAFCDEHCYVYAHLPQNCEGKPAVGFIAHMDVVNDTPGYGVKPQVTHYEGGDLLLPTGKSITVEQFPFLKNYVGMDIVTSDGSTILGADDKAGVAEIMAMVEYLVNHPEIKHGKIGIAFTPDEEIGNGASKFDVAGFGCDFAYTIDGEPLGEISYETFNAAAFDVEITGLNIHPGAAKDQMVNAVIVASDIMASFPTQERPEHTAGREGYFFFQEIQGNVEKCTFSAIIRDHSKEKFEERKRLAEEILQRFQAKIAPRGSLSYKMRDQYYNCAPIIEKKIEIVEIVRDAMREVGVEPFTEPMRGGTDGSGLSFMGLPCPNICTGGHNAHGWQEFVPVQCMEKVVEILLGIVKRA